MSPSVPSGFEPTIYSPGLEEIVRLLRLTAGDPSQTDKAVFYEQATVGATSVVRIARVAAAAESFSILMITFSETSGRGRYQITGGEPTAAGVGMPIISGGTTLIIKGVDNINNFRMIAETGQTMEYNALLFKAQAWMNAFAR